MTLFRPSLAKKGKMVKNGLFWRFSGRGGTRPRRGPLEMLKILKEKGFFCKTSKKRLGVPAPGGVKSRFCQKSHFTPVFD